MKHYILRNNDRFNIKKNKTLICILLITIISFILTKSAKQQMMIMVTMYSALLIAMGIISINTIKFNKDEVSKFIGIFCGFIGLIEVIYVVIGLNIKIDLLLHLTLTISIIGNVLPILAMYIGLKYKFKEKNKYRNIIFRIINIIVITFAIIALISIATSYVLVYIGVKRLVYLQILEYLNSLLILYISIKIQTNIKKYNILDTPEEEKLFKNIINIICLSRIPFLLSYFIKNISLIYMINQCIINIAMYYLYKYIVYTNIRKPYIELSELNLQLKYKAKKLKSNNKKLLIETDKIQSLKEELSIKEIKLQSTIDNSPNSIIVFSKEKYITYVNKTFKYDFNSVSKDYFSIKCLQSKILNYNDFKKNIDFIIANQCNCENYIYTFDNKIYLVRYTPLIIKSKLEGVLCILIDKTNIKIFQKELIMENNRYDSFLENIDDGIIVYEEGEKIYYNNVCKQIFKEGIEKLEFKLEDRDEERFIIEGQEKYMRIRVSQYIKNGKDKTILAIKDITEKKKNQMNLKKNQESYERFIDILPDGICILDKDLKVHYANKPLLNMLGLEYSSELYNKNIKDIMLLNVERENEINIVLKKVLNENKNALLVDWEIRGKEEKFIEVEVHALPFEMNNEKHIIFILKDLTNKKTSEIAENELRDRLNTDKLKTEFFANMSHELKTPLNVISSSNQLLEVYYKSGKINDYNKNIINHIELVRLNSYRLQRLINNIIDLTKMDSGFYRLNFEKNNIVFVIEELFMKVNKYAMKKNISLVFDTDMEEIYMVFDKSQIERIMLNLLSNCIKFTNDGGSICVYIYYKYDEVIIKVKDTGLGIPSDKLEIIFEKFTQADKTLSRNTEGSGIGLSIVKNLVELHGGVINVKSKLKKGTEFTIRLPIKNIEISENKDKSIYNIDEKINIEFSDIYY